VTDQRGEEWSGRKRWVREENRARGRTEKENGRNVHDYTCKSE